MRSKVSLLLVVVCTFLVSGCCSVFNINCPNTSTSVGGDSYYYHEFEIDGLDRRAKIYLPANLEPKAPVLFYFHGYSGDVEDSDTRRQFQTLWPEAIIVYAEGIPYNSVQTDLGWRIRFPYINTICGEDDDLKYIDAIMEHLRFNYLVDESKVFASGHSSGAFFTLALMELKPDLFKGFAPLGAYSRFQVDTTNVNCDPLQWTSATPQELPTGSVAATPRPVLYMFGVLENFDYDGPDQLRSYSTSCLEDSRFRNTVDELLIRNNCPSQSCDNSRTDYIKKTDRQVFTPGGSTGAEVHIQLYHGGHSWEDYDNGNQEVVDFFKSL